MTALTLRDSRLRLGELLRLGSVGLRTRRTRTVLSALGIAIGIAAMVSVLGISQSSRADLLAQLDRLGTNLLRVQAGTGLGLGLAGDDPELPTESVAMIGRISPVQSVASTTSVDGIVRRSDLIPRETTSGLTVMAVDTDLLETLEGSLADGRFLDDATDDYPIAVLGAVAARRLGITDVGNGVRVHIGDQWFIVVGILDPVELAADVDRAALIGRPIATRLFDTPEAPGTIVLRVDPAHVDDVAGVLAATAHPDNPDQVEVDRPSDAIAARAAASNAFTSLFLGLGAVALLVGGVGIANVMVIAVLERRSEIGLRRALGATRRHVRVQFLAEALLLSGLGGLAGVILGAAVTAGYAALRDWTIIVPTAAIGGGILAAMTIGALAGMYPAIRAAKLSPTAALRSV